MNPDSQVVGYVLQRDREGRPLVGTRRYRFRVEPGAGPPVRPCGSWTIAVASRRGGQPLAEDDPLRCAGDGSVDVWIQHDWPGPRRESNWLRVPAGPFTIVLRVFAPGPGVRDGSWRPPAIVRLERSSSP